MERLSGVLDGIAGISRTSISDGVDAGLVVNAAADTWSRAARRKRLQDSSLSRIHVDMDVDMGFTCLIRCSSGTNEGIGEGKKSLTLECTWVRGHERALFESFWSHVCRKVG